ncbi:MAG: AmmeMemoRadiSam system protein B [Spirochaetaceae bacterium]|nr:MAG: AmmeMemoRadiSam system protein B [Spirochaetaceae bacterium]
MQTVRPRGLSPGWYPATRSGVLRQCRRWEESVRTSPDGKNGASAGLAAAEAAAIHGAVVVPHAGWSYSGELAFLGFTQLGSTVDTVVVIGGHLGPDAPVLLAAEDHFATPLGRIAADQELSDWIRAALPTHDDTDRENSVEIHLPIVRYLFPEARLVWLRAPAGPVAVDLGRRLAQWPRSERIAVVGSTDLTHYGPRFGLTRPGSTEAAHRWVREENDRGFIDRCCAGDGAGAIEHALRNHSACSPGAAAAAMEFARVRGADGGHLMRYATSCDVAPDEHLVGYATITYPTS